MAPIEVPVEQEHLPITCWKHIFFAMIGAWILFVLVLLSLIYYPPTENSKSTVTFLVEGLKFLTYALTGAACGYPVGQAAKLH